MSKNIFNIFFIFLAYTAKMIWVILWIICLFVIIPFIILEKIFKAK
jgi:hypothetical protein